MCIRDSDERGPREPERGLAWWVANVLQPMELAKLVGKGFLFYVAFSATAFALSAKTTTKSMSVISFYPWTRKGNKAS